MDLAVAEAYGDRRRAVRVGEEERHRLGGAVLEAGRGMGMTSAERFWQLQIPLALPVIMNGVRTMLVILVSAAAIGAVVGAGGLGVPILSGMAKFNNAVVIHGAIPAILLALIVDRSL